MPLVRLALTCSRPHSEKDNDAARQKHTSCQQKIVRTSISYLRLMSEKC
ncbi:unnamed protein product [Larinioides sclopetarius]|uniref:Uncharacterized protein n=1 Tax=Larinioides sclopetarius TaxID=280406 RepID=A0AAV1YY06_9ARAC